MFLLEGGVAVKLGVRGGRIEHAFEFVGQDARVALPVPDFAQRWGLHLRQCFKRVENQIT